MTKKTFQIYTLEYYLALKINGLLTHATWMYLHGIMLSEKIKNPLSVTKTLTGNRKKRKLMAGTHIQWQKLNMYYFILTITRKTKILYELLSPFYS